IRNSKSVDRGQKLMQKLLASLEKKSVKKKSNEPMEVFLQRAETELDIPLESISKYYHEYRYANKKEALESLEKEIKIVIRAIA
ncbi:MAG: hypothetical protein U9Q40_00440, partial [Campylobacterota bacterium]|nr:hypothetical protein [Campylobacterota bacterium]